MHASLRNFFQDHISSKNFAEPSEDDSALLLDAFKLPPEEAIKLFESKGYKITWSWNDMLREAHAKAFTIAKCMKFDILRDIRNEVEKAIKEGTTLKTFQDNLVPVLQTKGWWGKRLPADVPRDDNQPMRNGNKPVQLGSAWRLETIFRTNIQTSYMAGRYKALKDTAGARPYWQYIAILDKATRPAHAAMHGRIYRHDDPIWNKWYPPAGYNCRCRIRSLSEYEIEKMGLIDKIRDTHLDGMPNEKPDVGWDYNPGEAGAKHLEELARHKQTTLEALLPKSVVLVKPEAKTDIS
ncbi:MAG: minor capsid protein [Candidatus Riflebacteria bacterium]|nr:minor capsid protein [Candidatus Riflebacteria bacterium]